MANAIVVFQPKLPVFQVNAENHTTISKSMAINFSSKRTPGRLPMAALLIFLLITASPAIAVQDTGALLDNASDTTSEAKPEAPKKVDVKPLARDEEIAQRLNEILQATTWFNDANATVDDGVVFLTGQAIKPDYREWATELATNTQDVAAVVNRMSLIEKSIWDFSTAFAELREFRNSAVQAIPLVVFALIVLALTWLLARLAGYLGDRGLRKRVPNSLLRWVATRAIMLPVLIFGVYLVLRVSGLTQLALTVLGGTGLIGLVIGIAFQDIAENFLASILISIQKPFRVGDLVAVDGHEGVVQRVTTRGTTLLTKEGNHVQIPNAKIYKSTIENYTANPLRRLSFDIGIGYEDSASQAQKIILETLREHSASLNDPQPRVLIESLGSATVNLRALFWIDGTKNDWLSVRSSCMRIAKQALMNAGISLPDEAREVIFPNGVPVLMNSQTTISDSASTSRDNGSRSTAGHNEPSQQEILVDVPGIHYEEHDTSEAEGNMESDMEDLKRQAESSWLPGEGEEVLVGED